MSKSGIGLRGERGHMVLARQKVAQRPLMRQSAPSTLSSGYSFEPDTCTNALRDSAPADPGDLPSTSPQAPVSTNSAELEPVSVSLEWLPGERKPRTKQLEAKLWVWKSSSASPEQHSLNQVSVIEEPKAQVNADELKRLMGKGSYPIYLDFSGQEYLLQSDEFLLSVPDVIKELDFSNNRLEHIDHIHHLTRLKRLRADNNSLYSFSPQNLSSLVLLSLNNNRIELLTGMDHLQSLVNLNLSDNKIAGGFSELGKLKSLQVLNLSRNNIGLSVTRFYQKILSHLQQLPRLKYLFLNDNPIQTSIFKYRYFVIAQLPKLQVLDGLVVTKEERKKAKKLDKKLWGERLQTKNISSTTKKNESRLERTAEIIIEGDPERVSRISEFRVREIALDIKPTIQIGSVTAPPSPRSEPIDTATETAPERSGWLSMKKKSSKRKSWDSSRGVRFTEIARLTLPAPQAQRTQRAHSDSESTPSSALASLASTTKDQHSAPSGPATPPEDRASAQVTPIAPVMPPAPVIPPAPVRPLASVAPMAPSDSRRYSVQLDELDKLLEETFMRSTTKGAKRSSLYKRSAGHRRSLSISDLLSVSGGLEDLAKEPSTRELSCSENRPQSARSKRKADAETIERMLNDFLSSASSSSSIPTKPPSISEPPPLPGSDAEQPTSQLAPPRGGNKPEHTAEKSPGEAMMFLLLVVLILIFVNYFF